MTTMAIGRLKRLEFQEYALAIVVVLLFVTGAILEPDTFPTWDNIRNMLTQASVIGVLAIGMTFVIATAGIDLSVGSMVAAAGVFGGVMLGDTGTSTLVFIVTAVAFATLLGSINAVGDCVRASGAVHRDARDVLDRQGPRAASQRQAACEPARPERWLLRRPEVWSLLWFGNGRILGIPVSVYVFLAITVACVGPAQPDPLRALRRGRGRQQRGRAHRRRAGAADHLQRLRPHRACSPASRPCCCARASAAPRR